MQMSTFLWESRGKEFALDRKVSLQYRRLDTKTFCVLTKTKLLSCQILKCPLIIWWFKIRLKILQAYLCQFYQIIELAERVGWAFILLSNELYLSICFSTIRVGKPKSISQIWLVAWFWTSELRTIFTVWKVCLRKSRICETCDEA